MKIFSLIIAILNISMINAQSNNLDFKEISNIVVADKRAKILNIGASFEFGTIQFQGVYTFNGHLFCFTTYNFNNTTSESKGLFGDCVTHINNNKGYSFGGGYQNFGYIGSYNNLEILIGFENQESHIISFFSSKKDSENKNEKILNQEYYKFFTQFNLVKSREHFDSGYSLKLSYFKFTENPIYNNATNFFIAPSYFINYKVLSSKSLIFSGQVGLSIPLYSFQNSKSGANLSFIQSEYVIGAILKIGVHYKFDLKK
ncbi:MAG: hypothetical protein QM535_14285 [Limnohabitans sp.]|nr:hypothetical protein [Limnohabitans sp.]